MTPSDRALDALIRIVGAELERIDDALEYQDDAFLTWLAQDLRAGLTRHERARDEDAATRFAERMQRRLLLVRAERRMPRRAPRYREAPFVATMSQAVTFAKASKCAPLLGLSVAAGSGRDLWDEPSETWLVLPDDLGVGAHVAMGVSGDSMQPLLTPRDVIVVKLGATPVVNDLVVARVPDAGFVVKRLASMTARHLELASFNEAYPPIKVERERGTMLGTVVARFSRQT
jgi:SOS-response transcriptional repressor LexA